MSAGNVSSHYVCFELAGQRYAIRSEYLLGVSAQCQALQYPGLPPGVRAVTHWQGRIYPVVEAFTTETLSSVTKYDTATFLFMDVTGDSLSVQGTIALAVSGGVRVVWGSHSDLQSAHPQACGLEVCGKFTAVDGTEAIEVCPAGHSALAALAQEGHKLAA